MPHPTCFINTLPRELLTVIFRMTLSDTFQKKELESRRDFYFLPPRNILRVCRHWAAIVNTTEQLWSQWSLNPGKPMKRTLQMATHFLQQCLSRSCHTPISFSIHLQNLLVPPIDELVEFYRILLPTQNRWTRARLRLSVVKRPVAIDVAQLALAPLRELRLSNAMGVPPSIAASSVALEALKVLELHCCHSGYLNMLSVAPNLEELAISMPSQYSTVEESIPHIRLEHLRSLDLCFRTSARGNFIERLVCPKLQHLVCKWVDSRFVQGFIESSRPNLLTMDITVPVACGLVPILRLLPHLTTLIVEAAIDRPFLNGMVSLSAAGGEFALAPLLEEVVLILGLRKPDVDALVRLVDSRWRAATTSSRKTFRSVRLQRWRFTDVEGSISSQVGPWEALRGCIEEGLSFVASDMAAWA